MVASYLSFKQMHIYQVSKMGFRPLLAGIKLKWTNRCNPYLALIPANRSFL